MTQLTRHKRDYSKEYIACWNLKAYIKDINTNTASMVSVTKSGLDEKALGDTIWEILTEQIKESTTCTNLLKYEISGRRDRHAIADIRKMCESKEKIMKELKAINVLHNVKYVYYIGWLQEVLEWASRNTWSEQMIGLSAWQLLKTKRYHECDIWTVFNIPSGSQGNEYITYTQHIPESSTRQVQWKPRRCVVKGIPQHHLRNHTNELSLIMHRIAEKRKLKKQVESESHIMNSTQLSKFIKETNSTYKLQEQSKNRNEEGEETTAEEITKKSGARGASVVMIPPITEEDATAATSKQDIKQGLLGAKELQQRKNEACTMDAQEGLRQQWRKILADIGKLGSDSDT
ncbi:hypothetical protein C922_04226 [Plasmodium inui San Antonio 1]|uniref:Uncharacterized protein n=1 Tax=Plasmodium inui San Antonio 1 TaxID=1237626 RepID=W7AJH5_9APIC|nr:hypothetical protein C922_04226 [Plasmodium inui San Antonio 1]EUD65486.1 hypothetical protein C922_04226 [Plasmodium inui San Antonio 1]